MKFFTSLIFLFITQSYASECQLRGTNDLGIVIERANSSIVIVNTTNKNKLFRVKNLGDLSHASAVFSRDGRYAYIFARDGSLSKIDILCGKLIKRIVQGGNSIGGAISQNGKLIAVSNYKPGGVKIFSSNDLTLIANIPASKIKTGKNSKTVGLVDASNNKFVFSLYDTGEIWIVDINNIDNPKIKKIKDIGLYPYDGLIDQQGRYYIAGLFGEDGMALIDLWNINKGVKRILPNYGKGEAKLPVYKMPHLEGWAIAGNKAFFPAVGQHKVLVADSNNWQLQTKINVHGQPVFVMARPDGRHIWINFAFPNNDTLQIIDTTNLEIIKTLKPGKGVLHMEFTPRGEEVWVSVRDKDEVQIYDTNTFSKIKTLKIQKPSGIFFTSRAHKIGL